MSDAPVIELIGVRAGYGGIEVLHGVDLSVVPGHVLALLGPNGAGKSSTVKVCGGLLPVTAGMLRVGGHDVTGAACHDLARLGVCTIPEGRGIFPNLSVRENLWIATPRGGRLADIEAATYERFPILAERRASFAGTLSGGEQQMLAMSRALVTDPAILLLDEVSMGLGPIVVDQLYEAVAQLAASGLSLVIVEQLARRVLGIADEAAIMVGGTVVRRGRPSDIEAELSVAYLGG